MVLTDSVVAFEYPGLELYKPIPFKMIVIEILMSTMVCSSLKLPKQTELRWPLLPGATIISYKHGKFKLKSNFYYSREEHQTMADILLLL